MTVSNAVVFGAAIQYTGAGAVISGLIMDQGAMMYTYNHASAYDVIVESANASHLRLYNYGYIHNITIKKGNLQIFGDGFAENVHIYDKAQIWSSGTDGAGSANLVTVHSGGILEVLTSGIASNFTVPGGTLNFTNGGTLTGLVVSSGGNFNVGNTGDITDVTFKAGGKLKGAFSWDYDFTLDTIANGSAVIADNVVASETQMNVGDGGIASGTTVNSGGTMHVYDGGLANETILYGDLNVSSGGTASSTVVSSGAIVHTFNGGTATATTVNSSGSMNVFSGGVLNGCTVLRRGKATVYEGGYAEKVTVEQEGAFYVLGNGVATGTVVNENGNFYVSSGGKAKNTIVNSEGMVEASNGIIDGVTVHSGGNLLIYSGAKMTGQMMFEDGAMVIPFVGSILDFNLTQTTAGEDALVNDISVLMGTPTYTLMVDDTQVLGTYNLAGGAAHFDKTISVVNTLDEELGSLTLATDADSNEAGIRPGRRAPSGPCTQPWLEVDLKSGGGSSLLKISKT
ncbi:MAG: AIDA repeat-containing protein [Victivallales bacterium]|nr:AIDA repeat-containing protein [Victivallales bacterium]